MPVADEEDYIGQESHLVPKLDPDDQCNGKKNQREDGSLVRNDEGHVLFAGYCNNPAGKATDHLGEGRCKHHGGSVPDSKKGAPAHNQNASKHSLTADPHHYHENLPADEQQFIEDAHTAILDRIRRNHGRDPDFLDEMLTRRIVIKLHIVSNASKYTQDVSGLVQVITGEHGDHEEKAPLLEEIRRFDNSIIKNLEKLGVLDDPESQKADALDDWRNFMESGGDSSDSGDDVIEVESNQE